VFICINQDKKKLFKNKIIYKKFLKCTGLVIKNFYWFLFYFLSSNFISVFNKIYKTFLKISRKWVLKNIQRGFNFMILGYLYCKKTKMFATLVKHSFLYVKCRAGGGCLEP
jgi:hypothetical protein